MLHFFLLEFYILMYTLYYFLRFNKAISLYFDMFFHKINHPLDIFTQLNW